MKGELNVETIENSQGVNAESFNKFLHAIYANDNKILEKTDEYIKNIASKFKLILLLL